MQNTNEFWMQKAIEQAKLGKTPYGAILLKPDEKHISAYNTTKIDGPQAYGEMNVIKQIYQLKPYQAKDLKLYTTVEPCPMCMSALVWAGIGHLIYGANIDDAAQFGHQIHISSQDIAIKAWYDIKITAEVERQACLELF
jgi:tRNA(Arg) A34 adenosine deaminase TadA